jgi:hypothetical protein
VQDKEKPRAVRSANIIAARGMALVHYCNRPSC